MEIRSVGIIGTGFMGMGIARLAALRGFTVTVVGREASLRQVREKFDAAVTKDRERDKLTMEQRFALMTKIAWTHRYDALADCDLVIESIVEEMDAKCECLQKLGKLMKPEAILATNTSSLDLVELAEASGRATQFLGMHFFGPVEHMKLVEIVVTEASSGPTVESASAFVHALGKHGIVLNGYVVNRLLFPMLVEAMRAVFRDRVTYIESCDQCMMLGLNHKKGPFELMDAIGIDVVRAISEELATSLTEPFYHPHPVLDFLIEKECFGRKSKKGFYDYADPENPKPNAELLAFLSARA